MSLATKYRPQTFDEVTEQSVTVEILKRQIETKTFKHAYGFFGTSGCGKTTTARIFAKAINNGLGDPVEIDGATAGDTETIKTIVETISQRAIVGEYKVIIIDECQMLGGGRKENSPAWTALLKCIEEMPEKSILILCSTNPEKIPNAVLNRLQRFNFAPISQNGIRNRLISICNNEGFTNYEKTCDFISKIVHGEMRNAISYLEQVADFSKNLSIENAKQVLGGLSYETMFKLTWAIQNKDEKEIITIVDNLFNNGQDISNFISVYISFVLDLIKYLVFNNIDITGIPAYLAADDNNAVSFTVRDNFDINYFNNLVEYLLNIKQTVKLDTEVKTTVEIMLIKYIRG